MTEFNVADLKDLGIGIVALILLYMIIRALITNQSSTNKALQDNTKVINKLANTLDKTSLMDEEFRKKLIESNKESRDIILDIQDKVGDIHEKVVV